MKRKGGKKLKRENKFFIFCLVMIVILGSFVANIQYKRDKRAEETNRIVKELQQKTTEADHVDIY